MNVQQRKNCLKWLHRLERRNMLNWMSDRQYLKMMYYLNIGKRLNLDHPTSFNEKLQWLKIHDRRPEYSVMVDKARSKEYVANKIGENHVIPTLGVWNSFDEIDFEKLPNQFVLKCTHDSGGLVICKDKNTFDYEAARKKINTSLKVNYYWHGREWPYKNVKPRIIAEKYMVDTETSELRDYKFFCFGGQCKCMKVDFDRFIEHRANYYDPHGNMLNLGEAICPPDPGKNIVLPKDMDRMLLFAEQLSKEIPFLRADFYDVNGQIYFGELTFFPSSGFGNFTDESQDYEIGKWLELPKTFGGGYILLAGEFFICLKKTVHELKDYKLFCFNGQPQITLVCSDRFSESGLHEDFFNNEWNRLPVKRPENDNVLGSVDKPIHFEEMLQLAKKLADDIPFVRTDFYEINGKVYFGEMTFFPASGFSGFEPEEWDKKLGEWIKLPENNRGVLHCNG